MNAFMVHLSADRNLQPPLRLDDNLIKTFIISTSEDDITKINATLSYDKDGKKVEIQYEMEFDNTFLAKPIEDIMESNLLGIKMNKIRIISASFENLDVLP